MVALWMLYLQVLYLCPRQERDGQKDEKLYHLLLFILNTFLETLSKGFHLKHIGKKLCHMDKSNCIGVLELYFSI